jgi:hypothetical protein
MVLLFLVGKKLVVLVLGVLLQDVDVGWRSAVAAGVHRQRVAASGATAYVADNAVIAAFVGADVVVATFVGAAAAGGGSSTC